MPLTVSGSRSPASIASTISNFRVPAAPSCMRLSRAASSSRVMPSDPARNVTPGSEIQSVMPGASTTHPAAGSVSKRSLRPVEARSRRPCPAVVGEAQQLAGPGFVELPTRERGHHQQLTLVTVGVQQSEPNAGATCEVLSELTNVRKRPRTGTSDSPTLAHCEGSTSAHHVSEHRNSPE